LPKVGDRVEQEGEEDELLMSDYVCLIGRTAAVNVEPQGSEFRDNATEPP